MVEHAQVERLSAELRLPLDAVAGALALLAEGAAVPFIARYRKERIGGLREEELWALARAFRQLQALGQRKARVLRDLEAQNPLGEAARQEIAACPGLSELEDLHQRHRAKRRSRGALAKERGLEPLAQAILAQAPGTQPLEEMAAPYVSAERGIPDPAAALEGVSHIIAEGVADDPAVRGSIRQLFADSGAVRARAAEGRAGRPSKYEAFYDFSEPVARIPAHRILAVRRGEREGWLRVSVEADRSRALQVLREGRVTAPDTPAGTVVETAIADAFDRLLAPALEAEFRAELKRCADAEAIRIFARNVRGLLLQPPAGPRRTLGVHPGPRGACALAVVDEQGKLLDKAIVVLRTSAPPAPPASVGEVPPDAAAQAPPDAAGQAGVAPQAPPEAAGQASVAPQAPSEAAAKPEARVAPETPPEEARATLRTLVEKHRVTAIAVGNGPASREADQLVRDLLNQMGDRRPVRALVSEAGAGAYATSRAARDELPDVEPPVRAAVSLARRLQDPLAELAQLDPKLVGIGQYQHDVNQHLLHEHLRDTVESCVNLVGVDVNSAPAALLAHVAGVGRAAAREIVRHRAEHGPFRSRAQLREVPNLTEKQLEQAAGSLRIRGGEQPLDATAIHPERYELVARIAADAGSTVPALLGNETLLREIAFSRYAGGDVGEPTLADLHRHLLRPGCDPRGAFRTVECHASVGRLEDLKPGMVMEGTVTNVTNFGAFVDIGLPEDGLVHVSHLASRFVRDPNQVVGVGRVVRVKVLAVDMERRRIALSMKDAAPPPRRQPRPEQTTDDRRQTADGRRQPAAGRRQMADGRRQTADGRRPEGARPPQGADAPQGAQRPREAKPHREAKPPQETKPKRDPLSKATPEDIARLIAHFHGR